MLSSACNDAIEVQTVGLTGPRAHCLLDLAKHFGGFSLPWWASATYNSQLTTHNSTLDHASKGSRRTPNNRQKYLLCLFFALVSDRPPLASQQRSLCVWNPFSSVLESRGRRAVCRSTTAGQVDPSVDILITATAMRAEYRARRTRRCPLSPV